MQQKWIGYRIKGFTGVLGYANRMYSISETAEHRLRLLNFWAKHGLQATTDAWMSMPNVLIALSKSEFIEFHKNLLFEDIQAFNRKLLEYLIWFNESRPHYALDL